MHDTLYEISNPPSIIYQMVYYIKLISFSTILLSYSTDILFKYLFDEDINIFNFTLLLLKLVAGFDLCLDLVLYASHQCPQFSIRYLLFTHTVKIAKSFLYGVSTYTDQQYLLVITLLPVMIMETLHTVLCIYPHNDLLINLRLFAYRALMPLQLFAEMLCIYYLEHHSPIMYITLFVYLIVWFFIELYDNYKVSNRFKTDDIKWKIKMEKLNVYQQTKKNN